MRSKKPVIPHAHVLSLLVAAVVLVHSVAFAANGNWNVDAGGNWSDTSKWSPAAVPGTATGDVVSLTYNIGAARTVTIDGGSRLLGTLNIGDATTPFAAYTLAANGGGNVSFNNAGLGASLVQLTTTAADTISAPIGLADNLSVTNVSGSTVTISGAISGAGKSVTKVGTGTLALNGANLFSGGVNLNVGKIIVGNAAALGSAASTFTLEGGTTLDCSIANLAVANKNPVALNGNFTFTGTQNLNLGAGPVSLGSAAGSRTVTVSANTLTLGGNIANGVATNLTKAGSAGVLALSGTNSYSGGTTVSAGALSFLNRASQPSTGTTTVAADATLGLGVSGPGAFGPADLDALFANTFAGVSMNATARVGIDTTGGAFTYSTPKSGTRGLAKLGFNTLYLPVANTYSGATALYAGVLQLDHADALPGGIGAAGGTSALIFYGGVLGLGAGDFTRSLGSATTPSAATFAGNGGWAAYSADRAVNLGGNASPSMIYWAAANTGLNARVLILGAPTATHTVDLKNPLDLGTNTTRIVQVEDGAAAIDARLSGVLSGFNNGHLSKTGQGTLELTAANTYLGNTTVQGGGTLLVTGAGSLGSAGAYALVVGASNTSGTLYYASGAASRFSNVTIGQTSANGTLSQTSGTINVTGNINMSISANSLSVLNLSGGTLAVAGALNAAQRGGLPAIVTLSGTGVLTAGSLVVADFSTGAASSGQYTQNGGAATVGSLLLAKSASDNTHSGTVDLNGGTLSAGSVAGGVATGSATNTSTFNFNGGTLKPTASSPAFLQGLTAANVKDGGAVLDTDGFDITVAQALLHGVLATTDSLTKNGAGTLTLTGTNTFTGPLTVNGGTLALGGTGTLGGGAYAAAITNNGALVCASGANQLLSGVLSGTGTLTKSGAGTLTLTGASTSAGATAVTAGKLAVVTGGALANSDVALSSGTTLGVRVHASDGQWSCKTLTLGSGTTSAEFNFYAVTPSSATAPVQINGDLVNSGTLNVSIASGVFAVGSYPLFHCTGTLTAGTLGAVTLPNGGVATLSSNAGAGTIDLNVTTANPALVWAGDTGDWDIDTTANWSGGLKYLDGDAVRFDDASSGTGPFTVTLPATVSPGHVLVDNPVKNYTLAGPGALAGEAALTKRGAGTLTLSGPNTYSGGTTLDSNGGTVYATVSTTQSTLGTGPAALGTGATLVLDNVNTAAATVSKANAVTGTGVLKLSLAANATPRATALPGLSGFAGTVHVASDSGATGDKLDASGVYAPAAAVQIDAGNTLTIGNAAATFGSLSVRGAGNAEGRGAIRLGTGAGTLAGPITLLGDTTIASDTASATLSGPIAGTALAGATNVLTQGTAASAAGCVFSGALGDGAGGGRLALLQSKGVLTLTGANTHSGGTLVNGGGTLVLGAADTLPVSGTLVLGGTNGAGNLTLNSFSQTVPSLVVASTNINWLNTVTLGANQTLTVNGAGGLTVGMDTGTNNAANCRMAGAGALVVAQAAANVTIGRAPANQYYTGSGTLDLSGLASATFGSSETPVNEIRVGFGSTCLGTLTLASASNSLVATTLQIGHSNSGNPGAQTGNSGTVTLGAGVNALAVNTINIGCSKAGGTLKFASQAAGSPGTVTIGGRTRATTEFLIGGKTGTGTGYSIVGNLDLRGHVADVAAGTVALGKEDGTITFTSGSTGNLYFDAGTFSATNLDFAAKSGFSTGAAAATLTVSGGVFTVTEGGLCTLASQTGWGTASGTINLLGGTFQCNADIRSGPSNCTSTITLNGGTLDMAGHAIGLGSQTVRVFNAQSGTLLNLGEFNNGAPLVKTGSGTLTLAGTNTYTGATVVSNGTLQVTGTACLSPAADVYLVTGAACQLDYDGTLTVHALYLDGALQKIGVYGAGNLPAYLSGTGLLQTTWPPPRGSVLQMR